MCPAGCCPEQNWFCCPDNMYCAATAADCPFVAKKEKLMKMAAKKQCAQLDVALNRTGSAALTTCTVLLLLLIVHLLPKKEKLMKMAAKKQCEGTMCPAGCCPEQNWFCCPDNMYCAATAADCPFVAKKEKLMKMAA